MRAATWLVRSAWPSARRSWLVKIPGAVLVGALINLVRTLAAVDDDHSRDFRSESVLVWFITQLVLVSCARGRIADSQARQIRPWSGFF